MKLNTFHIRFKSFFLDISLVTLFTSFFIPPSFAQGGGSLPFDSYEAELEVKDGTTVAHYKVLWENGKFSEERSYQPLNSSKTYVNKSLFNGNESKVVWENFQNERSAKPTFPSMREALNCAIRKYGIEQVKKMYHLPPNEKLAISNFGKPYPFYALVAVKELPKGFRLASHEPILGVKCDVYEFQNSFQGETTTDKARTPTMVTTNQTQKYWIDPISKIIYKSETKTAPPTNSPRPPTRKSVTLLKLTRNKRFPKGTFELTQGMTAIVPETMKDTPIPSGVVLKLMTGAGSATGVLP